jgi:hypothetical protein
MHVEIGTEAALFLFWEYSSSSFIEPRGNICVEFLVICLCSVLPAKAAIAIVHFVIQFQLENEELEHFMIKDYSKPMCGLYREL